MDADRSERVWRWVERTIVIIGFIAGLAGLYYTAGLFYHWDQPPSSVPTGAPMSGQSIGPYLAFALIGIGSILLVTALVMIMMRLHAARSKLVPPSPSFSPRPAMLPLTEVGLNFRRLVLPAPWLEFHFTMFNASGFPVQQMETGGRISVSGQEFHGHMESIEPKRETFKPDGYVRAGVKIPLSELECQFMLDAIRDGRLLIEFKNATLKFHFDGPTDDFLVIHLPSRLNFDPRLARTDPYLFWQLT